MKSRECLLISSPPHARNLCIQTMKIITPSNYWEASLWHEPLCERGEFNNNIFRKLKINSDSFQRGSNLKSDGREALDDDGASIQQANSESKNRNKLLSAKHFFHLFCFDYRLDRRLFGDLSHPRTLPEELWEN